MNCRFYAVMLMVVSACGIPVEPMADTGEAASESTTGPGATSTTGRPVTTSVGQEGTAAIDDGNTTGGATDDGTITDGGAASVCDPQPTDVRGAFRLDWDPQAQFPPEIDLDVTCTVGGLVSMAGELAITLDCQDGTHLLEADELGPIDLSLGEEVTLRAFFVAPWWPESHVLLLRGDQVIVAAQSSSSLPDGEGTVFEPPSTFAEDHVDVHCTDIPHQWYGVLVMRTR